MYERSNESAAHMYLKELLVDGCMAQDCSQHCRHNVEQCRLCRFKDIHDHNGGPQPQHIPAISTAAASPKVTYCKSFSVTEKDTIHRKKCNNMERQVHLCLTHANFGVQAESGVAHLQVAHHLVFLTVVQHCVTLHGCNGITHPQPLSTHIIACCNWP